MALKNVIPILLQMREAEQRDQQLRQRREEQVPVTYNTLAQLAANIESPAERDKFIQDYSKRTNIDVDAAREYVSAVMPTLAQMRDRMVREEIPGLTPDLRQRATMTALGTGTPGQVAMEGALLGVLEDPTINRAAGVAGATGRPEFALRSEEAMLGMPDFSQVMQQGLRIGQGTAISAPQEVGFGLQSRGLDIQAAGQEAQARIAGAGLQIDRDRLAMQTAAALQAGETDQAKSLSQLAEQHDKRIEHSGEEIRKVLERYQKTQSKTVQAFDIPLLRLHVDRIWGTGAFDRALQNAGVKDLSKMSVGQLQRIFDPRTWGPGEIGR